MTSEFTKAERKALRELSGLTYEGEAHLMLEELDAEFQSWRVGELESSELLRAITSFTKSSRANCGQDIKPSKNPRSWLAGSPTAFSRSQCQKSYAPNSRRLSSSSPGTASEVSRPLDVARGRMPVESRQLACA